MHQIVINRDTAATITAALQNNPGNVDKDFIESLQAFVETPSFNVSCLNDDNELVFFKTGTNDPNCEKEIPLIGLDICGDDGSVSQTVYFNQWRGYEMILGLLKLVFNVDRTRDLLPAVESKVNSMYWHLTGLWTAPNTKMPDTNPPSDISHITLNNFLDDMAIIENDYPSGNSETDKVRDFYRLHAIVRHEYTKGNISDLFKYVRERFPSLQETQNTTIHEQH